MGPIGIGRGTAKMVNSKSGGDTSSIGKIKDSAVKSSLRIDGS